MRAKTRLCGHVRGCLDTTATLRAALSAKGLAKSTVVDLEEAMKFNGEFKTSFHSSPDLCSAAITPTLGSGFIPVHRKENLPYR